MAYKKNDEKLIGKNLKKLRDERKMTQQQIADLLGYDNVSLTFILIHFI